MALSSQNLAPGQEQHEVYLSRITGRKMVQYDYRHHDGVLFSCVATTLGQARRKRERWLESRNRPTAGVEGWRHG